MKPRYCFILLCTIVLNVLVDTPICVDYSIMMD